MRYSGNQIYVVGPVRILNQLLVQFLTDKTGASCLVEERLSNIPASVPCSGKPKRLILFAFESGQSQLEALREPHANLLLTTDHLVLFNLDQSGVIEHDALKMGVHGFLYQQDDTDTLMKMVRAVLDSEIWVSRSLLTEYLLNNSRKTEQIKKSRFCLTKREVEILNMISLGHSNAMIADKQCISPHTVKTHVYHLFKKINVSSRVQAANWANRNLWP